MTRKLTILLLAFFLTLPLLAQENGYTLYKVRKKATLETVAFLNDVTVSELLLANPTLNPSAKLRPGDVVRIPVKKAPVTAPQLSDSIQAVIPADTIPAIPTQPDGLISIDSTDGVRIALLLPFENPTLSQSMCEIYSGMLLAASNSKKEVEILAYSTSDLSESRLDNILSDKDLIVGPVYKENFLKVASWAKAHQKPLVSPLTYFSVEDNPYVITMPPLPSEKSAPLKDLVDPEAKVIMIDHNTYPDKEQQSEFLSVFPSLRRFAYDRENITPQNLLLATDTLKQNVFLLPTAHQGAIEDVLSKITAINSPYKMRDISIIGSPSWLSKSNFSQTLLFRGNVSCVSSYYYDRQNAVMSAFFDNYISAFERIPSRFALRGYDIVDIMVSALSRWGSSTLIEMDGEQFIPLMTPYCFQKDPQTGNLCNIRWILVTFSGNYSVTIR